MTLFKIESVSLKSDVEAECLARTIIDELREIIKRYNWLRKHFWRRESLKRLADE